MILEFDSKNPIRVCERDNTCGNNDLLRYLWYINS